MKVVIKVVKIYVYIMLLVNVSVIQSQLDAASGSQGPKKLVLILDASGSMWGQIDGKTKIEIAREVLTGIIDELPESVEVGFLAYGHRNKGDCNDVEELLPLGPLDKSKLKSILKSLVPKGKTPISLAVKKAAEKLVAVEDEVAILLVSDGKETCQGDPCELVKDLKAKGINFKLHVVGFDVTQEEKKQLNCMAQSGGGLYFTANSAPEFKKAF